MKKVYFLKTRALMMILLSMFLGASLSAQNIWINELHYDNSGSDVGEFIEVVLENPGSYTLSDFTVTLYNGSNGTSYASETMDNFTVGNTSGNFTFYTWYHAGIQNGAPDGMCIDYQGTVVTGQFLSYEGTLTATDGPANGMTSVDIGVSEGGSTQAGESLQLSGSGTMYAAFVWEDPAPETPGALNNNQSFAGPSPEPSNYPTDFTATPSSLTIDLTWTDATGSQLPDGYLVLASDVDNITAPTDGNPVSDDTDLSDGSGALNIPYGEEAATFFRLDSETTYYFAIYSYTNAGVNIDYKTDGSAPEASAMTPFAINTNDFEDGDFGTWTTYSVASDKDWEVVPYGGAYNTTYFAQMNGYQQDELSNDWLISPSMNLLNFSDETMEFHTQWRFGNTPDELMLKYSTDYTGGDPTAATWTEISFNKAAEDDTWESSGIIDLSNIFSDNVHIAFQYEATNSPRRWGVDEIEITGTVAVPLIMVTSPELGDVWEQGSTHNITWEASNTQQFVQIELTTNASSTPPDWEVIATDVSAEDESWTWNIAPDQTTSYDCKIRISDYTDYVSATSEIFSIVEPVDIPDLVISEIMYNPPESGDDSTEFIEIYNNDDLTVDLDGYSLAEGITFNFPEITIAPGEYLLIAKDSMVMWNTFQANAWEWGDGSLSNSGEVLKLLNDLGFLVDSVNYDDAAPWPEEPDGNGPSVRFCDFTLDNAMGENWTSSVHVAAINAEGDTLFATPGSSCVLLPVADFTADTTIVAVGESVIFTDMSENNPSSWEWVFEGGNPASSNQQDPPEIFYEEEGEWDVSLTVTNEAGESTLLIEDYIMAGTPPTGDFEASQTVIDVGDVVDFTDLSTGDPESWDWLFEGGTPDTSTMQNPTGIQYNQMGLFDVTMTATNMFGSFELQKEDYIQVGPVGLSENLAENVMVYPNPSKGQFIIFSDPEIVSHVQVYNVLGEKIAEFNVSELETEINLQGQKGLYVVRIISHDNNEAVKRLIIQ